MSLAVGKDRHSGEIREPSWGWLLSAYYTASLIGRKGLTYEIVPTLPFSSEKNSKHDTLAKFHEIASERGIQT